MSLLCDVCGVSGAAADRSSADEVWVCPLCEFSALAPDDRSARASGRPSARPSNRLLFAPAQKDQKTVKGTVVWIAQGAQGIDGWKAGKIRTREETVKFVGPCSVKVGDSVRLHGAWEEDKKYGRQYRVQYATAAIGTDVEAIRRLVEVDASFRQIGPRRAGYIADYLKETGLDLEEILEDPETLADLKHYARLPDEAVECLTKSWAERREENLAKAELIQMGVPTRAIETIWRSYGLLSATAVRDNPYSLTETIDGFGIKEADKIAIGGLKLDRADQRRLVCGVTQAMRRLVIFRGHTWIALRKLTSLTVTELEIGRSGDRVKTAAALEDMIAKGRLVTTGVTGIDDIVVCDPRIHADERKLMATFGPETKAQPNPHFADRPLDAGWVTRVGVFVPNEIQAKAIEAFAHHRFLALTGAAGCGKSVSITMLLSVCAERGLRVALGAPTGKAAKRLSDLVGRSRITGAPTPMTIHKMLGYQGDHWTYNEKQKLPADVVILDECFDWKQPVLTESGFEYIGDIVEKRMSARVVSMNPATGHLELKRIVRWLKKPLTKPMLRIDATRSNSRRSARVIRCTVDHKIMTPQGYRKASELSVGDKVIVKGTSLTKDQLSIVIGSVFGDGSIGGRGRSRTSPQLKIVHGYDQKEWLADKATTLGSLAGRICEGRSGYKNGSKTVWLSVKVTDEMYEIRANMLPDGAHMSGRPRWKPSATLLAMVDEMALAVWFLDNGSVTRRTNASGSVSEFASLHTERFGLKTNRTIASFLKTRFGLTAKVQTTKRSLSLLRFSKNETKRLMDIVRPHTPSSMTWKVSGGTFEPKPPPKQPDTAVAAIRSIDSWTSNYPSVYDLEIEDNHNYVAGNIVVSNCSMIDVPLMGRLIDALDRKTCVVLVGDHNQLPPVGPGAVLRDVIEGELCHVVRLVDVLRQAGALRRNATEILRGSVVPTTTEDGVTTWEVQDWHKDPAQARAAIVARYRDLLMATGARGFLEVQVLSPMYDGEVGIDALNQSLRVVAHEIVHGSECDPDKAITVGDKVIQTKNDYTVGLMNGDQGVVLSTNGFMGEKRWEAGWIVQVQKGTTQEEVKVPLNRTEGFMLAYAISVHRGQGSEWEHVIGAVHSEHRMLSRNLIYTMATRASRTLLLVGDRKGLHDGTRKDDTSYRRTLTAPSWLIERVAKDPSIV